jgi:hypothetical protein
MARIRIVDEWLRCPASPPTRWRSIMVVAEQWAEQRVLMRAYAESHDQTRPTIVLHGAELAIGPAGTDPNGAWGIHVHPQIDGRAQELAEALRVAARRLAGSKGNPARLADEASDFERKRTDNWSPGTPPSAPSHASRPYFEPMIAASQPHAPAYASSYDQPAYASSYDQAAYVSAQPVPERLGPSGVPVPPTMVAAAPTNSHQRVTPLPVPAVEGPGDTHVGRRRRRGWTSPLPPQGAEPGGRTALGYESGAGAQSAIVRLGLRPATAAQLGKIVDRTVPQDFEITAAERDVLNALGERALTAYEIARMTGAADPRAWMQELIAKLVAHDLDIVAQGYGPDGQVTYRLAR